MKKVIVILLLVMVASLHTVWAADRIELDNTSIVGTRELPKVLYIVPWQTTQIGTQTGVTDNGSFEDGLTALDRGVVRKEAEYYDILYGATDAASP